MSTNEPNVQDSLISDIEESLVRETDESVFTELPIVQFIRKWRNEKRAPEILDYEKDLVNTLTQHLRDQQQEIDLVAQPSSSQETQTSQGAGQDSSSGWDSHTIPVDDLMFLGEGKKDQNDPKRISKDALKKDSLGFPLSKLYQMDIERVKYFLTDYHRIRLDKIEDFAFWIRSTPEVASRLSEIEKEHCETHAKVLEAALGVQVNYNIPDTYRPMMEQRPDMEMHENLSENQNTSLSVRQPDLDTHVYCRVRDNVLSFRLQEDDEPMQLSKGDIYFMVYRPLREFLKQDKIELI